MTWREAYNKVMETLKELIEELKEQEYTEEQIYNEIDKVISDALTDLGFRVSLTRF